MQRLGEAWFAYNGKQCAQMGLRLLRMPVRRAAERLGERAQALGRDGYLWMDGGAYAPVEIEAECMTADGADLRAAREWLMSAGEAELLFSDEPDRAYLARAAAFEAENELDCYERKRVAVRFICQPHRYLYPAAADIVLTAGGTVVNPGTAASEPRISVQATGDFILYVNGTAIEAGAAPESLDSADGGPAEAGLAGQEARNLGASVIIDSRLRDCLETDSVTLANGRVIMADFPVLSPGPNAVSWTGAVTKVTITPRWRDV